MYFLYGHLYPFASNDQSTKAACIKTYEECETASKLEANDDLGELKIFSFVDETKTQQQRGEYRKIEAKIISVSSPMD